MLALALAVLVAGCALHRSRPEGSGSSVEADARARVLEAAVGLAGWRSTGALRWKLRSNDWLWDKNAGRVRWRQGRLEVLMETQPLSGRAFEDGRELFGQGLAETLTEAYSAFVNDSFWLFPFDGLFDAGTRRESLTEPGPLGDHLLLTFGSGGTTPGDAYLLLFDGTSLPSSWRMWVKILPVGGLEVSFADWRRLPTGALVAQRHETAFGPLLIEALEAAATIDELEPRAFERLPPPPRER